MRRRIIREKVVQALYAHAISGDPPEHVMHYVLQPLEGNKPGHEFARRLVLKTIEHSAEIDRIVRGKVRNWDMRRIALLDRLILRMGICELLYFREIPPKVSMDEAIELAKLFSTFRSGQFVNGVLDAVLGDLMLKGHLAKTGRGLSEGGAEVPLHRRRQKKR